MSLNLKRLVKENIKRFEEEEKKSFDIHMPLFEDGIVPGATEDDKEDYDLNIIIEKENFTILEIYDDEIFIGGAIVKDEGNDVSNIEIFYLTVDYLGKGIGKEALELVESYFPNTKVFQLVTPIQVMKNIIFYVNKCCYKIVEVFNIDKERRTCDFMFEKRR